MKFENGDVVVLKSGGPAMTVRGTVIENPPGPNDVHWGRVTVNWFDEKSCEAQWADFPEACLDLVDDPGEEAKEELLQSIPLLFNILKLPVNKSVVEDWLTKHFGDWENEKRIEEQIL
jgi:uncharacterized protein YodC (DUF2158 family)